MNKENVFVLIVRIINPISQQLQQCNAYYFRGSLNTTTVIFNIYIAIMMTMGEWYYSDHRTVKSTTANGHSGVGAVCVHVPITSWCDSPVGWRPSSIMAGERTISCYVWNYTTWEKRKLETLTNYIIYTRNIIINLPPRFVMYKYQAGRVYLPQSAYNIIKIYIASITTP